MATLHVDLREGWVGDDVIARVNGREHRLDGVRTRLQIGLADQLVEKVDDGPATIEVLVPDRHLAGTTTVEVVGEHWVGVSVVDDVVVFSDQAELFGYV